MTPELTLADMILRDSYRPKGDIAALGGQQRAIEVRNLISEARKFVLDDSMSSFLCDLSNGPFMVPKARQPEVMDAMRHGARLPHRLTWIEYSTRAFHRRLTSTYPQFNVIGAKHGGPTDITKVWSREGWLLEQDVVGTAVRLTAFADAGDDDNFICMFPFTFCWQTTDDPLPWNADTFLGQFATGLIARPNDRIGVIFKDYEQRKTRMVQLPGETQFRAVDVLLIECIGTVRRAISLLATLGDIPAISTEVRQHRGFVARGAYRKYLDHNVIRLNVPQQKDTKLLARRLIAAARRRAHQVRGHWRLYQREGSLCEGAHVWRAANQTGHQPCQNCSAWRTWIAEHQRGDATLGFVLHDYALTHDKEAESQKR